MCVKHFNLSNVSVIVKTLKNYEKVALQLIKENFPKVDVTIATGLAAASALTALAFALHEKLEKETSKS